MSRSRWFVWSLFAVLVAVAWQTGVLIPAVGVLVGFVLGVATTWVVARLRLGGS